MLPVVSTTLLLFNDAVINAVYQLDKELMSIMLHIVIEFQVFLSKASNEFLGSNCSNFLLLSCDTVK